MIIFVKNLKDMKTKLQLLSFCFTLLFMVSCGSDDPKKNAEKAGECKCEYEELEAKEIKLQRDLLKTYKKKLVKTKNPDYDPKDDEKRYEKEYTWEREVDDWDEHVRIQLEIFEIAIQKKELRDNYRYVISLVGYEASDNQDDYDDWIEEFNEEFDDYVEDNCEKLSERNSDNWDEFSDKEDDYFDEIEEDYDYDDR